MVSCPLSLSGSVSLFLSVVCLSFCPSLSLSLLVCLFLCPTLLVSLCRPISPFSFSLFPYHCSKLFLALCVYLPRSVRLATKPTPDNSKGKNFPAPIRLARSTREEVLGCSVCCSVYWMHEKRVYPCGSNRIQRRRKKIGVFEIRPTGDYTLRVLVKNHQIQSLCMILFLRKNENPLGWMKAYKCE